MSTRPRPIRWVLRRHLGLLTVSMFIMVAAPYLGSLPVRTVPAVVALATAGDGAPTSGELELLLGSHAGDLSWVLGFLVFAGAMSFGLALLNTRVAARLSSAANRDLRLRLHRCLLDRPPSHMRKPGVADMTRTALLNQTRVVATYACNTMPAAIGIFFAVAIWGQTLFSAVDSPGRTGAAALVVGGVVLVLLAINLIAVWISGKKSQQSQREVMKQQGAFIGLAGESVQHLSALQLNVAQDAHHARIDNVLSDMSRAEVRVASWSGLSSAASGGVVMLGIPILVLAWTGLGLDGARLAVMIPALLMLQRAVSSVGSLWTTRKVSLPSIELVADMMRDEPSIRSSDAAATGSLDAVKGRLRFDDVHWTADDREILRGVDLEIEPGTTVALVGAGGSGKSSLLRLALRIDDPSAGTIELDGTDVGDVAIDELRSRIGILDQHPAFFTRSLRDNLVLDGRDVDDDAIMAAARIAHIADKVEELGLDTPLAAAGKTLAGSEKRRLALARLLLRDPDVIFMDELEAGLPQALAQDLLRDARAATRGKTCLMVTHRPDLLEADLVAFVHQGCILETGSHAELAETCAPYRSLLAEKQRGQNDE